MARDPVALPAESIAAVARQFEPDRHLAALLAGDAVRAPLLALAAYAAELRRIPVQVSEPMLGEIRLHWWRDAIAEVSAGTRTGHPVADALGAAIANHGLPAAMLVAMTEARAFDLYDDPLPDRASLDGYLTKLEGAPFELAYRVVAGAAASGNDFLALQAAGRAHGLARLLLGVPQALSHGRTPLPAHLLETTADRHDGMATDRIAATAVVAARLVEEAGIAAAEARQRAAGWSGEKRNVLLPLAMLKTYLALVRRAIAEGFRRPRDPLPLTRVLRIGWSHWRGRF